jgi:tetratricopeptide (TPR) repeat protein
MVMRYWGETGIYAETFAPLADSTARGILAEDLLRELRSRGWDARSFRGDRALVTARLAARQPVVALIEDSPGAFHFVVVVAWTNTKVIYHDPARAPFRVVDEQAFDAAWAASNHWTLLALPPHGGVPVAPDHARSAAEPMMKSACGPLVAEGVRVAETGDKPAALEIFSEAAGICPSESAPLREAAGVYALDGKWTDAARLAKDAVTRDPSDEHAWRILASSAYIAGDPAAALKAWNAAGEPLIDLVTIQGLSRTRHVAATNVLGLDVNTVLTRRALAAAARRLSDLPSADEARLSYRPLGGGRASVEAVVVERPRLPASRASIAGAAVRLVTDRELAASAASLSGSGELLSASWRWWAKRPRLAAAYAAPSSMGIWRLEAFGEEQTYGEPAAEVVESRRGGSLTISQWTGMLTRWQLSAGLDTWGEQGRTGSVGGSVDQRLAGDRLSVRGGGSLFAGSFSAWTAGTAVEWRSVVRHEGIAILGRAGLDLTSADAPRALWSGAGTGHARGPLLRAHPLLEDGRLTGDVFGRHVYHASAEARRWLKPVMKLVRIAPAVFVDVARASDRLLPGAAWHADAGAGLRLALPGSGVVRLDVAKGLRDGTTALSVGWTR